jgi:hypothetical protein
VRCFLAVGFLVPCLLEPLWYLGMPIEWMGEWLLFTLWPAFGFVMASDTGYGDSGEALGFLMSVVANALLYGLLGVLVSFYLSPIFPEKRDQVLICPLTGDGPRACSVCQKFGFIYFTPTVNS